MSSIADKLGLGRREVRGAFRGTRERADRGTRVVVIGGGIAGTSAACVLAERGVQVTLLEKEPWLGGRLAAWRECFPDGETFQMERATPVFFRHYYNVRSLLRRIDPELGRLKPLPDYPVIGLEGSIASFANLPTTTPLNLLALLRGSSLLKLADLRHIQGDAFRAVLNFDPAGSYRDLDGCTAKEWLDRLSLPRRAREVLFRVFARSVFHPEDGISAAELIARIHFDFLGNPEGMGIEVLEEPSSDALWKPMERYLGRLGGELCFGVRATRVERDELGTVRVFTEGSRTFECDGLVIATCVSGLRTLVAESPDLREDEEFAASIAELGVSAPSAVLRLYFDRAADEDRPPFVQTAGLGVLDSIMLHERIEGESRRWSLRYGGSVVQLQTAALDSGRAPREVRDELVAALRSIYPEFSEARVLHEVWLDHRGQPGFGPGSHARRPRVVTPYGNVVLAGDYVKLPFPTALMERAAASGFLAANQLLDRWDVRGETVWSIGPRGFMARFRKFDFGQEAD
jgi:isorenieratene synthase